MKLLGKLRKNIENLLTDFREWMETNSECEMQEYYNNPVILPIY